MLTTRAQFAPNPSLLACSDQSKSNQMEAPSDNEQLLPRKVQSKDEPNVLPFDTTRSQQQPAS